MRALRPLVVLVFAVAAIVVGACDGGTQPDRGTDAALEVAGAQFFRDVMPSDQGGPAVRTVAISPIVRPGASARRLSGELDPSATAVAIALAGDVGYWIVQAGIPDIAAPTSPTYATEVSFARTIPEGPRDLVVRAVDSAGRFGPPTTRTLTVQASHPDGALVVSLAWDDAADLDLHVVDPNGVEVYDRNINSYQEPGPGSPPEPPGTTHDGGVLDVDSNAQCVQDGARAENVVWSDEPPKGHYLVRVDASSMCGAPAARWKVQAFLHGVSVGAAQGTATEDDTRFPHERGSGVLALEFDVP